MMSIDDVARATLLPAVRLSAIRVTAPPYTSPFSLDSKLSRAISSRDARVMPARYGKPSGYSRGLKIPSLYVRE
jgi:hypothetical protein